MQAKEATGSGLVPAIDWNVVGSSFLLFDELTITPLPVHHGLGTKGEPFYNWGFKIKDLAYISDLNFMPEETRAMIQDCKVLVIDALSVYNPENPGFISHLSGEYFIMLKMVVEQAIDEMLKLDGLEKAYLTGMCHSLDHEDTNRLLRDDGRINARGIRARVSFDGLQLEL